MKKIHVIVDSNQVSIDKLKFSFSSLLSLTDLIKENILICPISFKKLTKVCIDGTKNLKKLKEIKLLAQELRERGFVRKVNINNFKNFLTDGSNIYPIINNSVFLYPNEIIYKKIKKKYEALRQYLLLNKIKNSGEFNEVNASLTSIAVRKHHWRFRQFCKGLKGRVLDIGCDKPSVSKKLFPEKCQYVGTDAFASNKEFRLIGLAEMLPIADKSFDNVSFNTSLDHILDYHTAIENAARVLKPKGKIIISTYAWLNNATLLTDAVHFHHFREIEIINALSQNFSIEKIKRYKDPKSQNHRYGLYILASKIK
jgi:SAM-dependent methyltransferase